MAFQALPISTVLNVSVATPQTGVGAYNTSNIGLFTRDTAASSFGSLGYKIYLSPTQVATDFGTSSATYSMALGIFGQQPNILNNQGYLAVIPYLTGAQTAVQSIIFPTLPTGGAFILNYNSNPTASIAAGATAATVQTALRAVTGLTTVVVAGTMAAGFSVTFTGVSGAAALLTVSSNTLTDANSATVTPVITTTTIGSSAETLDAAIIRTQGLIQYFGVMTSEIPISSVTLAAAALVQTLNKLLYIVSITSADVASGGLLDLIRSGSFTQTRALFYGDVLATALNFMAAYAGLGQSTNFAASLSTQTLNLKTLNGVQPDPSMNPTLYNLCNLAGADVYASIQGIPKVLCSGANDYFDNQFNLRWYVGAVQVSAFNYLATTNTKIPQTETGMDGLKGSIRNVSQQAVSNGFLAPGAWTSATTFGNQVDFLANISQVGYFIYSSPIATQLQAQRVARNAPPISIAIKYAGAIQSGSAVIYVNP